MLVRRLVSLRGKNLTNSVKSETCHKQKKKKKGGKKINVINICNACTSVFKMLAYFAIKRFGVVIGVRILTKLIAVNFILNGSGSTLLPILLLLFLLLL